MDDTKTLPPSRLLSLPAELRLRIYSFCLAPTGSIYLHRTPTKRHAVTPSSITPALLATNRQINAEATGVLYTENVVHTAIDAHDTAWPAINESRLPQPVLQKIEHLCVLLDCTALLWGKYGSVDFEAFTALTALRTLRLRALVLPDEVVEANADEGADPNSTITTTGSTESTWHFENFPHLAIEILERIPLATKILYGLDTSDAGNDAAAVAAALEEQPGPHAPFDEFYTPKFKLVTLPWQTHEAVAKEVSASDLQGSLSRAESDVELDLKGRRGCKAGSVADPWGEYRWAMEGCTKVALEKGNWRKGKASVSREKGVSW